MGFGDHRTSKIVETIADEEIAHVAVGVDWFLSVCQKMNRAPCPTFKGTDNSSLSCFFFFKLIMSPPHSFCTNVMIHEYLVTHPMCCADLIKEYGAELRGPFNHSAREIAGIPRDWYGNSSYLDGA